MKNLKKQMQKKLQSKSGFTLVELIVVLVIMGILTAALVPTVTGYIGDAREKVAASNLRMVEQAALLYLTDWETDGKTGTPTEPDGGNNRKLKASDLVTKGYLSSLSDTDYEITYDKASDGRYTIILTKTALPVEEENN